MKRAVIASFLLILAVNHVDLGWAGPDKGPNDPPRFVTGSVGFTKQVIASDVDETHAVVAADLDGDGDLDVVATDYLDATIFWYENDGALGFTAHVLDANLVGAYPASLADLDQDNDMDVLACGFGADTVVWYENDGAGNFTRHDVDTNSDGAHSNVAGDMDGDGDLDLLVSNQDAWSITWYENDGSMGFTLRTIDDSMPLAKRAEFADIDNDQDMDVVACAFGTDEVVWYRNDGNEVFTKRDIALDADGAYYCLPADIDGDGDVDVVGASQLDNKVAWYENDGTGVFTTHVIDTEALGARMVQTVDMDGDGDLDVVASSPDDNTVSWYENDGTGGFSPGFVGVYELGAYGVWTADLNADGVVDVLSASRDANAAAIHLQIRVHEAALADSGDVLPIGSPELEVADLDHTPDLLVYTLTTAPNAGELRLGGVPVLAGGTFTQADIDADQVAYAHDGSPVITDAFAFTVSDGIATVTGSYHLTIGEAIQAHWPLDESAGLIAGDIVGGNDGTLASEPVWSPGIVGGALAFDGIDDSVELGNLDVTGADGITLALWMRPDALNGDERVLSKAEGTQEQDHYWMISLNSGTQLRFRLKTSTGTSTLVTSQSVLTVGEWYHVTCTYDNVGMRIYGNGELLASQPKTGVVATNPTVGAAIGNQPPGAGDKHFAGRIDDVRLYRRALLPAEIALLANPELVSAVDPESGDRNGDPQATGVRLRANVPNPFNPMTTIRFDLHRTGPVALDVYDLRGRHVRRLAEGRQESGSYAVVWDGRDANGRAVASGTYLYQLRAGATSQVRRMLLVR